MSDRDTDRAVDMLLDDLDDIAMAHDAEMYGLPLRDKAGPKLREAVRSWRDAELERLDGYAREAEAAAGADVSSGVSGSGEDNAGDNTGEG